MQSQSDELQEDKEMKRLFVALMLIAFVTTGAFAQIVLGVTGVQYYQEQDGKLPTVGQAWSDFQEGTGVYWGGFAEIILGKLGLGLSFNQQTYKDPWGWSTLAPTFPSGAFDQWNYDLNFFLSYHLFGGRAFIDPFLQAGFGVLAYDWKNKDTLINEGWELSDDPMMASGYFDFGGGLGINLGGLGIFVKGMWNVKSNEPLTSTDDYGGSFVIPDWPVMPFKWVFGAKLIL